MFTSKVWTDDSKLLQKSNLAARQPQGAASAIQAITGEGLAQVPYVAARGGVELTTFRTEGIDNLHLNNHAPNLRERRLERAESMGSTWDGYCVNVRCFLSMSLDTCITM